MSELYQKLLNYNDNLSNPNFAEEYFPLIRVATRVVLLEEGLSGERRSQHEALANQLCTEFENYSSEQKNGIERKIVSLMRDTKKILENDLKLRQKYFFD